MLTVRPGECVPPSPPYGLTVKYQFLFYAFPYGVKKQQRIFNGHHTRHLTHQIFKTTDIYHTRHPLHQTFTTTYCVVSGWCDEYLVWWMSYSTHNECPFLPIPMFFFTHSVVNVFVVNVILPDLPGQLNQQNRPDPSQPDWFMLKH